MKIVVLASAVALTMSACVSKPEIAGGPARSADTYLIELFDKQDEALCVDKTRTKEKNCSTHKDNKSCNVPQDQIIWVWKKPKVSDPFMIVAKPNNLSPFDASAACTGAGSVVVCRIKDEPGVDLFDYNIVVNPGTERECVFDPRILIY